MWFFSKEHKDDETKIEISSGSIVHCDEALRNIYIEYQNEFCFPENIEEKYSDDHSDIYLPELYNFFVTYFTDIELELMKMKMFSFSDFVLDHYYRRYSLYFKNKLLVDQHDDIDTERGIVVYHPETLPYIKYFQDYIFTMEQEFEHEMEKQRAEESRKLEEKRKEEKSFILKSLHEKKCKVK